MSYSLIFTAAFAIALVAGLIVEFWLASRQMRHVARHRAAVPAGFAQSITLAAHQRAADYTAAKTRLNIIEMAVSAAILLGWTLLGGLDLLNKLLLAWMGGGMLQQIVLIASFAAIGGLLGLPFSLWRIFKLEESFGFNRMTVKLWLLDTAKWTVVGAALGLPFAALILWLMAAAGPMWWLWAWGALTFFLLLLQVIYPLFIAPWFNKFTPLDDPVLQTRVMALLKRCGFAFKGLFVMDGSTRSAHANAYFTGFGVSKRVVFYDTLLSQLDAAEMEAVLAHELGHLKHRHLWKSLVMTCLLNLPAFALLGWVSTQVWFYAGLGVRPDMTAPNNALALLLFMLAVPVFSFFIAPMFSQLSRKNEFEADTYAVAQTSSTALSAALLKLYKDNGATLTPDPVFVKFYYSHPPISERLAHMAAA
ncbi:MULTISPECIES: M48 family metallopeptidase [unclassified Variovorax]|uniref:M48 family metallopeptidase n=1 Tax=unclassified Variovorax TaxID=663243 RepID=UPI0008C3D506|nr:MULTISPECIES: M48 family metallopeptidase [unclassified Variovorax]SEJ20918.1 STE24 endopeptidase [Variovorax sp. OK202]SFC12006.1 STE24 endopeptidase [Variovorax sp. OK212]